MDITVKRANSSDLDELMRWREIVLREVFSIPRESRMDELLNANREYYSVALEAGEHVACFAYMDGEAVGCGGICLYSEMPSPDNQTGKCAYLMNIFTMPDKRRQGVGDAVVRWLLCEAENWGAEKIYLEASEQARPLYRQLGFCDMDGYMKYLL